MGIEICVWAGASSRHGSFQEGYADDACKPARRAPPGYSDRSSTFGAPPPCLGSALHLRCAVPGVQTPNRARPATADKSQMAARGLSLWRVPAIDAAAADQHALLAR
eukprot:366112-Chlamydomonas_euryale.AAC.11